MILAETGGKFRALEKVVLVQRVTIGGHQRPFQRNIGWAIERLLHAIGERNLAREQLQGRQLFIRLVSRALQPLVALAKRVKLNLERIVVSHFPSHAPIAAHHTDGGEQPENRQQQHRVNRMMRNMETAKAPMKPPRSRVSAGVPKTTK